MAEKKRFSVHIACHESILNPVFDLVLFAFFGKVKQSLQLNKFHFSYFEHPISQCVLYGKCVLATSHLISSG